jgi:hypothetical protein
MGRLNNAAHSIWKNYYSLKSSVVAASFEITPFSCNHSIELVKVIVQFACLTSRYTTIPHKTILFTLDIVIKPRQLMSFSSSYQPPTNAIVNSHFSLPLV